jgi:hypothetical protein
MVNAGPGADTVTPGAGHDNVITGPLGETGNDTVVEGAGSDTIDGGGGGLDTVDYGALTDPIRVNAGEDATYTAKNFLTADESVMDEDRMVRVERVIGTDSAEGDEMYGGDADDFRGGAGPDLIYTGSGDDILFGEAGDDTLMPGSGLDDVHGGDGVDTVTYRQTSSPIVASIQGMTASGDGTDNLLEVENLQGTWKNDHLTGSDGPNVLAGYATNSGGTDQLFGLGGDDLLKARDGDTTDTVDCGAGTGDVAEVDPGESAIGCETVRDGVRPPTPLDLAVSPASPSTDNTPQVTGTLTGGAPVAEVRVFIGECSGTPAATGTAAEFTAGGIAVPVPENQTSVLRVQAVDAGNEESFCEAEGVTYIEDSVAPLVPGFTSITPASPANRNNPTIKGFAAADSTVRLYKTAQCSGAPAATASAGRFAAGVPVTVPDDSTTAFRATATDVAGNASACSAPITYVEDSTAPPAPALSGTTPASPGKSSSPTLRGSAAAGSTVQLFTTADCSGSPLATASAAALADPGIKVKVGKRKTRFRATATDSAANESECSSPLTYVKKKKKRRR